MLWYCQCPHSINSYIPTLSRIWTMDRQSNNCLLDTINCWLRGVFTKLVREILTYKWYILHFKPFSSYIRWSFLLTLLQEFLMLPQSYIWITRSIHIRINFYRKIQKNEKMLSKEWRKKTLYLQTLVKLRFTPHPPILFLTIYFLTKFI